MNLNPEGTMEEKINYISNILPDFWNEVFDVANAEVARFPHGYLLRYKYQDMQIDFVFYTIIPNHMRINMNDQITESFIEYFKNDIQESKEIVFPGLLKVVFSRVEDNLQFRII